MSLKGLMLFTCFYVDLWNSRDIIVKTKKIGISFQDENLVNLKYAR